MKKSLKPKRKPLASVKEVVKVQFREPEKMNLGKLCYASYLTVYKREMKKTEFDRFLERLQAIKTISDLHKWRQTNGIEFVLD